MDNAATQPDFMTDSAVRRVRRKARVAWHKARPIIVATRKKPDGSHDKVDWSETVKRYMLGALVVMVTSVCPWTRPLFGLPSDTQSLDRIEKHISTVETSLNALTVRVDNMEANVVKGMIEGMGRGAR